MRKAYGPQRRMSPEQKAAHVARSIREHQYDIEEWFVWKKYGLGGPEHTAQRALVLEALRQHDVADTEAAYERWTQR